MITETLDYNELKDIFYSENSQTLTTQKVNALFKDLDIGFETCHSREDGYLYLYTHLFKLPLFKSRFSYKSSEDYSKWVSYQRQLLPVYKVLNTFSSDISDGTMQTLSAELVFNFEKKYTVKLELVDSDNLFVEVTYYNCKYTCGSYSFDVDGGELTVYSKGWGGSNSFCYKVSDTINVSDFAKSTLREMTNKVKDNLIKMGYTI